MMELVGRILIIFFLVIISILYTRENIDVTGFILLFAIIGCLITGFIYNLTPNDFFGFLPLSSLIYLIFMSIFISLLIKEHIFEYFTLRIIRFTKTNIRLLFYLICVISALMSGVMDSFSVALIIVPIIFRATRIMGVQSKPFILGATMSILIGNMLTPFASPSNIIFSEAFNLDLTFYFKYLFILFLIIFTITLIILDFAYIKNIEQPDASKINILLEIMSPDLLIINKRKFYRFIIYFILILIGLLINFYPYVFVALGVIIIALIEEKNLMKLLSKTNWNVPGIFVGFFLLIGCIQLNGTINIIQKELEELLGGNIYLAILIIFLVGGAISSFISRSLALITFIYIFEGLFLNVFTEEKQQIILMVTLILSILLGGNFLPQAQSFILRVLENAKEENQTQIKYKMMKKTLQRFTIIIVPITLIYIMILALIIQN